MLIEHENDDGSQISPLARNPISVAKILRKIVILSVLGYITLSWDAMPIPTP